MSAKIWNRAQKKGYEIAVINGNKYFVEEYNAEGHYWKLSGTTVPADALKLFAKGCEFTKTNGTVGTTKYINEGSSSSCDFNAVETPGAAITGVTADEGLYGGGTEGTVALAWAMTFRNNTGGTLTKGTLIKLDAYTGTDGVTVVKADADTSIIATHVLKADVLNAANGVAYPFATVTGLDTNGQAIGDKVYLSATVGTFAFSAPAGANQVEQLVGVVKVVSATVGEIVFFPGYRVVNKIGTACIQSGAVLTAQIGIGAVTPTELATASKTQSIIGPISALPAPSGADQNDIDRFLWTTPIAVTITSAKLISSAASVGSDATNHFEFNIRNASDGNNLGAANTSTVGNELVAEMPYTITVDQNLTLAASKSLVLRTAIKDDGGAGPTNLSTASLKVLLTFTLG